MPDNVRREQHFQVLSERAPPGGWLEICQESNDFTLAFPVGAKGEILLGLKKRGFGQGLVNGFGGKVEEGESIRHAAARELQEECGLRAHGQDVIPCGRILTVRTHKELKPVIAALHLFVCTLWTGEPVESEEMKPAWHKITELPLQRMWPEASIYLPPLLEAMPGTPPIMLSGRFDYSEDNTSLKYWKLERYG